MSISPIVYGPYFPISGSTFIQTTTEICKRIFAISARHFGLFQGIGVMAYGADEVLLQYVPAQLGWGRATAPEKEMSSEKIRDLEVIKYIRGINAERACIHGGFYLGSGILNVLVGLETANLLNLRGIAPSLETAGWNLFLFANLFALEQHIKLYQSGCDLGGEAGHRIKVSAILGIANALGYVLGTLFIYFEQTSAIAIALSIFAVLAGTIKFFYDYFFVNKIIS
jgi:hypothetical protein